MSQVKLNKFMLSILELNRNDGIQDVINTNLDKEYSFWTRIFEGENSDQVVIGQSVINKRPIA